MVLYTAVMYLTFIVFLGVALMLYKTLIADILETARLAAASGGGAAAGFSFSDLTLDDYRVFYFFAAIMQGLGNGIIAGLMGTGRLLHGLRHSFLMVAMTYFTFKMIAQTWRTTRSGPLFKHRRQVLLSDPSIARGMPQMTTTKSETGRPALPECPTGILVGGTFRDASDGATTPVIDPATNQEIARVAKGTVDDTKAAIEAATDAFQDPAWRELDPSKRGKLLLKLADQIKKRFNDFAVLEMLQNGKTMREAQGDIGFVANTLTYYAGLADKIEGTTVPMPSGRLDYTLREPIGPTAHIAPWNYPLLLSVRSLAPALAAGNTVILKPASWTPLTGLLFGQAATEAGFPAGVVNVVPGGGGTVGETLVRAPQIEGVAFTGSCAVGQNVMRAASETTKRVALELGGKSPVIVYADADINQAVKGIGYGIFANAGQMCWAGSRLIVHESVADQVFEGLKAFAAKMKVGPGWGEDTRMGPLVHKEHLESVTAHVQKGKDEGAQLLTGGERVTDGALADGNFLQPTVFTGVTPEMTIWKEEIFGPVLACTTFSDTDEAVKLANDTSFGLWSGIWTRDISLAHRTAGRLDAGMVGINDGPVTFPQTPFGGFKQSGVGSEQGLSAIEHYTRIKNVMLRL